MSQVFTANSGDPQLKGVTISALVAPSGLIAPIIDHHLRCAVNKFSVEYIKNKKANTVSLKKVTCDAASVTAAEYTTNKFVDMPAYMKDDDRNAISKKIKSPHYPILQADANPTIVYEVQNETPTEITGLLTLKGRKEPLTCTKTFTDSELFVRCPIVQSKWGMAPYSLLGLISVVDEVVIEARVPRSLL